MEVSCSFIPCLVTKLFVSCSDVSAVERSPFMEVQLYCKSPLIRTYFFESQAEIGS